MIGAINEDGKVIAKKVPNVKSKALKGFILANIAKGATMVTDDAGAYRGIAKQGYGHEAVNHSAGEYYRAGFHTNGIENFGNYIAVSANIERAINYLPFLFTGISPKFKSRP